MIRNAPVLAGACLLSVALGFVAGKGSAPDDPGTEAADRLATDGKERASSRPDRPRGGDGAEILSTLLKGRAVRDVPPAELAEMIGKLSKYDHDLDPLTRARRAYQLQLLIAQLSASQLEEIATAATADKETRKSGAIGSVISELAAKDPDRALAWAAMQENPSAYLSMTIAAMAENDPDKATALFRKGLIDGTISGSNIWQASSGISRAMGKLGALPLMDFVDTLPMRHQSSAVYNAMRFLPPGEEAALLDELHRRRDPDGNRQHQLDYAFAQFAMKNPKEAGEWLDKMGDNDKKASMQIQAASRLMQGGESEVAGKWMTDAFLASPGKEKELFIQTTRNMSYNNPEDIPKIAAYLPQGIELTASDLKDVGRNSIHAGLGSLASVADAIRNPDEKAKFIADTLSQYAESRPSRAAASTEFEILSHRISGMGFTGGNLEKVKRAIEAAKASGNR